jgi:HD superfamily phosphohydrolase
VTEKVFRDAIHGDVTLSREVEVALMDTPEFQRMRGIKQLGTASLVYPSAVHSRFEHSLGTCFLARRIVALAEGAGGTFADEEEKRALFAAALLHDVSHIPFGHTFEDERHIFPRHDSTDRFDSFLRHGELGRVLRRLGLTDAVFAILGGGETRPVMREIVSGTICSDLLDYLARDAFFCGLTGTYDQRIFRYFRVDRATDRLYLEAQKDGIIREDVVSEIVNLLRLRYFLSERVYFHHSKTASGAMISRAVEAAVNAGLQLEDMFALRDDQLLWMLERKYGRIAAVRTLMEHFLAHRLYKRAYVLTRRVGEARQQALIASYHRDRAAREEAERQLSHKLKLKDGELIVYCPAGKMQLKEADIPVRVDEGPLRSLGDLSLPEIKVLSERHRDLWRFYVFVAPEHAGRMRAVAAACEAFFQHPNELPALQTGQLYL